MRDAVNAREDQARADGVIELEPLAEERPEDAPERGHQVDEDARARHADCADTDVPEQIREERREHKHGAEPPDRPQRHSSTFKWSVAPSDVSATSP
jgi:hypothetical protein